jgi:hypothetical protein
MSDRIVVVAGALADHHDRFPSMDLLALTLGLPVQHTFGGPRGPVSLRQGTFLLLAGAAMTSGRPDRLR